VAEFHGEFFSLNVIYFAVADEGDLEAVITLPELEKYITRAYLFLIQKIWKVT